MQCLFWQETIKGSSVALHTCFHGLVARMHAKDAILMNVDMVKAVILASPASVPSLGEVSSTFLQLNEDHDGLLSGTLFRNVR